MYEKGFAKVQTELTEEKIKKINEMPPKVFVLLC